MTVFLELMSENAKGRNCVCVYTRRPEAGFQIALIRVRTTVFSFILQFWSFYEKLALDSAIETQTFLLLINLFRFNGSNLLIRPNLVIRP